MRRSTAGRGRIFEEELLFGEATATILGLVESLGLRRKDLAERLDVSPGRVSQILAGGENLTLRSLAALGWSMGVRFNLEPSAIADRSGSPAQDDPPLPAWLEQLRPPPHVSWRSLAEPLRKDRPFDVKRRLSVVDGELRDVAA